MTRSTRRLAVIALALLLPCCFAQAQPAPSNDDCADALPLALPSLTAGSTGNANPDPDAFLCGTSITAPGIWYSVIGNGNTITASTCENSSAGSADYDTKISVYCGTCDELVCVTGNDDAPACGFPIFRAEITWCAAPGVEYFVFVHGFGTATGTFQLDLFEGGACDPTVVCFEAGACCLADGCVQLTAVMCEEAGGLFQGEGVPCVPPTTIDLWAQNCNFGQFVGLLTAFDDDGTAMNCGSPTPPDGNGNIAPAITTGQMLSMFNGLDARGDWTIRITDNFPGDTGTLDAWGLLITDASGTTLIDDTPGLPIPDAPNATDPGPAVEHTITVDDSFLIEDLDIQVNINHTWIGDLVIELDFVPVDLPSICPEERPHPGWNRVSAEITLTPNQPTYWSVSSGTGSTGVINPTTVPPFTSLDPDPTGFQPGRICADGSGDRCLRGYIVAWAVDENNDETAYDHLSGSATLVNYRDTSAWEYGAWAHQSVGVVTGDGTLNLDGTEYSPGFDLLLLDFYVPGVQPFFQDHLAAPPIETDLTLHPETLDARQGSTPVTTKAVVDVWNENEVKFDGLDRCITCWDQTLLRNWAGFGIPNNFLNLQTPKGKARIDGVAGDGICDIFDETEGPCGTLSSDTCGEDAALLGVVAKHLGFGVGDLKWQRLGGAAAGMNLVGMGTQGATVQYTPLGPPPTATAGTRGRGSGAGGLRARDSVRRAPATAVGPGFQDRVSGTEKGSVLFISKVELRWTFNGELIQDTFVSLLNDGVQPVKVQMEFINGDPPLD